MRRPERSGDRTRSGGSWFCADRSGAETAQDPGDLGFAPTGAERRPHKIRGILVLRRPERSGDRTRSGGSWSCADRSGAETAQDPGDLGLAPTGAERRPHKIRGILVLRRPERSGDTNPSSYHPRPLLKQKRDASASPFVLQRALEDSNPRPFGP